MEMEFFELAKNADFNSVIEPKTAQQYMEMSSSDRFLLQLKWINSEEKNKILNYCKGKINRFEKKLFKTMYVATCTKTYNVILEHESRYEIIRKLKLTELEFSYLIRYRDKKVKNPKHKVYKKIRIEIINYELKEDLYYRCKVS